MKVASWNVNSILARLELFCLWLQDSAPDIVLLQETKVVDELFPRQQIEDLGYNIVTVGQKTYNGVAILSKYRIDECITQLPSAPNSEEARYVEAVISVNNRSLRVASVYVPQGFEVGSAKFEYKLAFYQALKSHLLRLLDYDEITVIGGDYNVAPNEIDVYDSYLLENSLCFTSTERKSFQQLLSLGYYDAYRSINRDKQEFSWWDYRGGAWNKNQGMRIDHLLLSPEAFDRLVSSEIEKSWRGHERPSDHVPVSAVLKVST